MAEADVVVATGHARAAGALAGGPAGLADLVAAHPGLVGCLIDGFGDHPTYGGLPGHGTLVHAACGRMQDYAVTFQRDRPVYVAPPQAAYAAGTAALQGITAALYVRARTGHGQLVRTSLLRAFTAFEFWGPHGRKGFTPPASPSTGARPVPPDRLHPGAARRTVGGSSGPTTRRTCCGASSTSSASGTCATTRASPSCRPATPMTPTPCGSWCWRPPASGRPPSG